MDLETRIRRFEQQLAAFEKLHTRELEELARRLAAYKKLQSEEVKMLNEELAKLRAALEHQPSDAASDPDNADRMP